MKNPSRWVVGITGASGVAYGFRLLSALARTPASVHLLLTENGRIVARHELGWQLPAGEGELGSFLSKQCGFRKGALVVEDLRNVASRVASGSFKVDGVVLCPASTGRIAAIAHGDCRDLLERACDVALKEGRRVVVVPRETPLSQVHLRNLWTLSRMGVHVIPASPAFYQKPKTIDDLIDFVVGRVLNVLGIEHELFTPWGGASS